MASVRSSCSVLMRSASEAVSCLDELLERRQALADVVLELGRLFQQAFFEALKAAVDIPGLAAEEDVADLVEIARRRVLERRRFSVRFG